MKKLQDPGPAYVALVDRPVRLGKLGVKRDKRTLKLARYFVDSKTGKKMKTGQIPRTPASVVRSGLVPPDQWGTMGNDAYGDCTIAGAGHASQITTAVVSDGAAIHSPTTDEILAAYWATGNPPTPGADDNGRFELDVLNYWRKTGIAGKQIEAFASIDLAHLHGQIRWSIETFGFCYLGLALPISAQTQTDIWRTMRGPNGVPGSWGGHCVIVVDYDKRGPTCVTWGELMKMTWSFLGHYCDEAYAVITPEWLNASGDTVEGLNVDALMSDLKAISG